MRQALIAAIALVLGVMVGGLGPRGEVRRLLDENSELRRQPGIGSDLSKVLIPSPVNDAPDDPPPKRKKRAPVPKDTDAAADTDALDEDTEEIEEESATATTARRALEARRIQARAALIEDVDPSEEELQRFDAAVAQMNAELNDLADELFETFNEDNPPPRREAMRFAARALDVLAEAEDAMNASLSEESRESADEQILDPFAYLDPALADKLERLDE